MNKKRTYLKIEDKVFNSLGKIGYIVVFILLFSLFMSIIDFILYILVDNYSTTKFIFTGEMGFSKWWTLMWNTHKFPYFKIGFFALIFLFVGIYRSQILSKEFSK